MKNAPLLCAFDVGGLLCRAASAARIPEESEKSEIPALIFRSLFERVKKAFKP
ncbi:MAG: hypothetical protein NZM37_11055 [Sandaracinaceae bacterium]|nr:hypothetical protein [Sandaracinaceae bacterium]